MPKVISILALLIFGGVLTACDMEPKWTKVCEKWDVKVNPNVPPPNRPQRKCEAYVIKCKAGVLDSDQCDEASKPSLDGL